ncbi:methionyl-tRNA synthetase [Allocatelliglobosispora scoriae]|uniref:Methionyl-tRNA synthetase n=1 Tax=Allocatelliglobosispora scoriae TaxID=643052 RepID=A0A841BQD3_9ACTN|nr:class I tRNA ligase family protein [Allocatelliglobosispora scoriae]MBB5869041.1 methionyl-tRNA synthetase [Allocatelliglobosispora scoriae]
MTTDKLVVITMPQPTVNGPLHIGHLSGPYVAADIAARAARARGVRAILSTGLDVHQNYVLLQAERTGIPVEKMLTEFRTEIVETYRLAGIRHDNFTDPLLPGHDIIIDGLVNRLITSGAVHLTEFDLKVCSDCDRTLYQSYVTGRCSRCGGEAAGGACEGCGSFTSAQDLVDPVCGVCGGAARTVPTVLPVLRMEDYRDRLTELWVRAELPSRVRSLIAHHLRVGLPAVPLAYPADWGVPGTAAIAGMRVDAHAEVALTDLYGIARHVYPDAETLGDYRAAWGEVGELWHCHGIDNAFWYAVYWPAIWAAAGLDPLPLTGLAVNEFYTLDGRKFSTSRNHAIWANELLTGEDPAIVRLYLAWDRPDRYASDFTMAAFTAFRDRVAPLLDGTAPTTPMPPELAAAELARGLAALRLDGFSPPTAARCLLTLLAAGAPDVEPLRSALTGRG